MAAIWTITGAAAATPTDPDDHIPTCSMAAFAVAAEAIGSPICRAGALQDESSIASVLACARPRPCPPSSEIDVAPSGPQLKTFRPVSLIIPSLDGFDAGSLTLRRAETEADVHAAQTLRYKVFYDEMGAHPVDDMARVRRDYDLFDPLCEHLLVIDRDAPKDDQVIGTYRLLFDDRAAQAGTGFYSETRYDMTALRSTGRRIMEVSRSCVLAPYRKRATINLLWNGIAAYVIQNSIDFMVGIASFHGTDVDSHRLHFSYLHQFLADPEVRPRVRDDMYVPLPQDELDQTQQRQAFKTLPPLVRAYLLVGARVGDGVMIDHQFNTVVVSIVLDTTTVTSRYETHFRRKEAQRT